MNWLKMRNKIRSCIFLHFSLNLIRVFSHSQNNLRLTGFCPVVQPQTSSQMIEKETAELVKSLSFQKWFPLPKFIKKLKVNFHSIIMTEWERKECVDVFCVFIVSFNFFFLGRDWPLFWNYVHPTFLVLIYIFFNEIQQMIIEYGECICKNVHFFFVLASFCGKRKNNNFWVPNTFLDILLVMRSKSLVTSGSSKRSNQRDWYEFSF